MLKQGVVLFFCFIALLSSYGCVGTLGRSNFEETQSMKNEIAVLKSEIRSKDQEIYNLRDALNERSFQRKRVAPEVKSRPSSRQIQIALKNAGYYKGAIDGKLGKRSRKAIRQFQRDNHLKVDGKVGKRTWAALRKSLY
jgi:hypothetical protein